MHLSSRFRTAGGFVVPLAVVAALVIAGALASAAGPRSLLAVSIGSGVARSAAGSTVPSVQATGAASPSPQTIVPPWWFNLTASGTGPRPAAMDSASAAWDPVDNVTVLFGGCQSAICPSNETWLYSRGQWVNVTNPSDAPPARYGASMDFDANMQGVLLFGGYGTSGFLGDTWLYSGGRWTNLTWVSAGPAPRRWASMTFDPQPEENGSVLFGGQLASGLTTNDTWVWQSWSGWVPLTTSVAPLPVDSAGFAYSPRDGYALLFGGTVVCGIFCFGVVNQSWELYAGEWWPTHSTGPSPGGRSGAAMGYSPTYAEIVLFSGINATFSVPDDTWAYQGGSWRNLSNTIMPSARYDAAFASNVSGSAALLFGGTGVSADANDTWVFESVPSVGLVLPSVIETAAATPIGVGVISGSPPYDVTVDFGDGTSGSASGIGPTLNLVHTYGTAGTIHVFANVTDAVGVTYGTTAPAVNVVAGPAVSIQAPIPQVDVGAAAHLGAVVASSGTLPLNLSWAFGDGSTGAGANVSHAYAAAGTFTVTLTATDHLGGTATASATVRVAPLPTVTAEASPSTIASGLSADFFANVTGGTAPYAYAWSFGDGNTSGAPDPVHAFPRPGTYTVNVWVNDSGGVSTHATVSLDVVAQTVVVPQGVPLWFWAALGALIAVGALGAVLLVLTLRKGKPPAKP